MSIMTDIRVQTLKSELRRAYTAYVHEHEHEQYDCGRFLAEHISTRIGPLREECNRLLDELEALGETVPARLKP